MFISEASKYYSLTNTHVCVTFLFMKSFTSTCTSYCIWTGITARSCDVPKTTTIWYWTRSGSDPIRPTTIALKREFLTLKLNQKQFRYFFLSFLYIYLHWPRYFCFPKMRSCGIINKIKTWNLTLTTVHLKVTRVQCLFPDFKFSHSILNVIDFFNVKLLVYISILKSLVI